MPMTSNPLKRALNPFLMIKIALMAQIDPGGVFWYETDTHSALFWNLILKIWSKNGKNGHFGLF